jgi:hypothetical protein
LRQPVNRQIGRAGSRALPAIDTGIGVAPNLQRAQQRDQPHQRAIRTEIAAPQVLHQHRAENQNSDDNRRCHSHIAKEIQHFYVGNQAIWSLHEIPNSLSRHDSDHKHEEAEQKIFQATERKISPSRQARIAPEDFSSQLPQVFRKRSYRAEPRAERLFQKNAHQKKSHE